MRRLLKPPLTVLVAVVFTGVLVSTIVAADNAPEPEPYANPPPIPGAQGLGPAAVAGICVDGEQASGAKYRICIPTFSFLWNGDLVVHARGYVAPDPWRSRRTRWPSRAAPKPSMRSSISWGTPSPRPASTPTAGRASGPV